MEKQYEICYQNNRCGVAYIQRQGLFLIIRCYCDLAQWKPFRIILRSADRTIDLGICTKQLTGYGLEKRIVMKDFPPEPVEFYLEAQIEEKFIPVKEEILFPSIEMLHTGKFAMHEDIPGIILSD